MTVAEAIRQIRREAGRLSTTAKVLEQVQRDLAAPSADAIREIAAGGHPLTAEARLVAVLQEARRGLDNLESDLRYATSKRMLRRLDEDRKTGTRPTEAELRLISEALEALHV